MEARRSAVGTLSWGRAFGAACWLEPLWWRMIQALLKEWPRHVDYAFEAWNGDAVHDFALDRTGWVVSRAKYVAWWMFPAR